MTASSGQTRTVIMVMLLHMWTLNVHASTTASSSTLTSEWCSSSTSDCRSKASASTLLRFSSIFCGLVDSPVQCPSLSPSTEHNADCLDGIDGYSESYDSFDYAAFIVVGIASSATSSTIFRGLVASPVQRPSLGQSIGDNADDFDGIDGSSYSSNSPQYAAFIVIGIILAVVYYFWEKRSGGHDEGADTGTGGGAEMPTYYPRDDDPCMEAVYVQHAEFSAVQELTI